MAGKEGWARKGRPRRDGLAMAAWASGIFGGPKNKKSQRLRVDFRCSLCVTWCPGRDSNPHSRELPPRTRTLANYPLKVACLPVPPPGHVTNCRHNNAVRRFDSAHYKEIYLTVKNFLRFFVTRHANAIDKPFLELRHKLDKNLPSSQAARPSPLKSLSGAKLSAKGCA